MAKDYDLLFKEYRMLSHPEQLQLAGRDGQGTGLPLKLLTWLQEAEAATNDARQAYEALALEKRELAKFPGQHGGVLSLKSSPELCSAKQKEEEARLNYERLNSLLTKESRGIYTGFDNC